MSEILVAVHAAGVNPTDWRNRAQVTTIARMPLVLSSRTPRTTKSGPSPRVTWCSCTPTALWPPAPQRLDVFDIFRYQGLEGLGGDLCLPGFVHSSTTATVYLHRSDDAVLSDIREQVQQPA